MKEEVKVCQSLNSGFVEKNGVDNKAGSNKYVHDLIESLMKNDNSREEAKSFQSNSRELVSKTSLRQEMI